ncbi:VG15 protein [Nocardia terpenica]|uniref:Phage head morphogenesis domain-containing protein n=1 Tax=Nocardia terpenica TaxID=455432 RepID=A0A291RBZ7_9NOCA|nr:hypothetical protein [Nocardia terpenica]ATL64936.1 hypothetical protein CRH09_00490 [Nocardia terpenica]
MTPGEFRGVLDDLATVMLSDLADMWAIAPDTAWLFEAFPELVTPYVSTAGELSATWYDSLEPGSAFRATPAELPPEPQLRASLGWALSKPSTTELLAGAAQRYLFNGSRDTVRASARAERGASWGRYASASACRFCQVLTTRGHVYRSEHTADFRAHDHCRCIAVPIRPGQSWQPPDYVQQWTDDYHQAARLAGSTDARELMKAYRQMDRETT